MIDNIVNDISQISENLIKGNYRQLLNTMRKDIMLIDQQRDKILF